MSIWARTFTILALLALLAGGRIVSFTACTLLGVYLAVRRATRTALRRTTLTRQGASLRLFPGEEARLVVRLHNPTRIPLAWLAVTQELPGELAAREPYRAALSLPGRGSATLSFPIEAKQRGVYRVGALVLETGDPWGVERFAVTAGEEAEVVVYPRVHPVESLGLPSSLVSGAFRAPRRSLADPSRVAGVRAFLPGDSIRHVHWRATAHTGELKVKTFEPVKYLDVVVLLDLVRAHYRSWNMTRLSELAIEVAASLAKAAADHRQSFGLYAAAREGAAPTALVRSGMGRGEAHLRRCLEILAALRPAEEAFSLDRLVARAMGEVSREATLFVVTPHLEAEGRQAVARALAAAYRVFVVEVREDEQRAELPRGVGYARVAYGGDIARLGTWGELR